MSEDHHTTVKKWKTEVEGEVIAAFDDTNQRLERAVTHYPKAGGKCTRPILLFGLVEMFGTDYTDSAFLTGVGLEMIHISTLIGDDHPVMDDDNYRRGVPAVHTEFTDQDALLAASMLLSRGMYYCQRSIDNPETSTKVLQKIDELVRNLCEGQHNDITQTAADNIISEEQYMRTIKSKTAYMYRTVGELAVILSSINESTTDAARHRNHARLFGHHIGIAHQLFNDVLDFTIDTHTKDKYSDIKSQTQTLVTIRAHDNGVPIFDDTISVKKRAELVEDTSTLSSVRKTAETHMNSARTHLTQLPIKNEDKKELIQDYLCILDSEMQQKLSSPLS